jgi:hypothetical protein
MDNSISGSSFGSLDITGDRKKRSKTRALLAERDAQINALQKKITSLANQLASSNGGGGQRRHHPLVPSSVTIQDGHSPSKRQVLTQQRERMGRNASFTTRSVLKNTKDVEAPHPLAQRIIEMFKDPNAHTAYLSGDQFAKDLIKLNHKVKVILEREPRVAFLQSPAYIFGDIHGNLEDLHFFSDNVWRLGMSLTAGNFVFMGDYVDRGMSCLECVAYLLAMKLLLPDKVFLLRGNHETRDVNGWEEHYGERSFLYQCRARFGDDLGYRIWEQTNQVFDRMPLAAVIDQDIFCVHGGIPRPIGAGETRIQDILHVPKVAGINPPYEHEDEAYQQVASDCIWSDPASEDQEIHSVDPETGFGESLRGGGAICFGNKAVTQFLSQQGYSYIMRAHEAHAEGVAVSKGARVFTVFSTSKDHHQGSQAMAGCILVDFEKLQVINRSPAYRNQYVHRRDSASLLALSENEIQKRIRLGLVTTTPRDDSDDDEEEEEWEDLEDESESDPDPAEYRLSANRRSSVDLKQVSVNELEMLENSLGGSNSGLHFSTSMLDTDFQSSVTDVGLIVDFEPNKRNRFRKPRVSSIHEGMENSGDEMDQEESNSLQSELEFDTGRHDNNRNIV